MLLYHFKNFISHSPIISSLMYIPVMCAIIVQVYKDLRKRSKMPETMTELYTASVLVLIKRYMIETGNGPDSRECQLLSVMFHLRLPMT